LLSFDETLASEAIETLSFGALNGQFARYWLSLWKDGLPPVRRALRPAQMKELLPGMAIIEFHHDGRAICRLAGSAVAMAIGFDPTGMDILALTPEVFRAQRLQRYRTVAAGAVSRCIRRVQNRFQETVLIEDVQVPLSDAADNMTLILYHAGWRPQTLDRSQPEILRGFDISVDEAISIMRPAPLRAAS
jgi:hypothetical protein